MGIQFRCQNFGTGCFTSGTEPFTNGVECFTNGTELFISSWFFKRHRNFMTLEQSLSTISSLSIVFNQPLRCNFQRFTFDYPVNGLCEDADQFCLDNAATTTTTTTTSITSTTTTTTTTTTLTTTNPASNVQILDGADCWFRCFGSGKYFYDTFYILMFFHNDGILIPRSFILDGFYLIFCDEQ